MRATPNLAPLAPAPDGDRDRVRARDGDGDGDVRRHTTLQCTPAMAAGVSGHHVEHDELLDEALARKVQS